MFTVFKKTGEFVCIDHGAEEQVKASLDDDMLYVEGAYPSDKFSFETGEPVPKNEPEYDFLRMERNARLQDSDWTQMPDSPLSDEEKQKWAEYRQKLRDLPESVGNLDELIWPTV